MRLFGGILTQVILAMIYIAASWQYLTDYITVVEN